MAKGKVRGAGKMFFKVFLVMIVLVLGFAALNYKTIVHIYHGVNLFSPTKLTANFRSLVQHFPVRMVSADDQVSPFSYALRPLPDDYVHHGETRNVIQFIKHTDTTGLIVTNGAEILYENYFQGNIEASRVIVWSVSKSVISALMGIAVTEGYIRDIHDPVTAYVPSLAVSGYNGVPIKDVLQMSSGIRFNEDYFDASSDFNKIAPRSVGLGGPIEDVLLTLEREREPGTYNQYASCDAQVLGMVIRAATGMDLATYTQTRLWQPAGMEFDAYWLLDSAGVEVAFGGLNTTLRDLARFGNIYLHEGFWNGQQIVPRQWIRASITPDADHLLPGQNDKSDSVLGYGYQWWIPGGEYNDYLAMGIYGQAIYVNPYYNIVIAKTSAYAGYDQDGEEMELESISFFRSIAKALGQVSTP